MQDEGPTAILHLVAFGDIGGDLVARVVPEQQVVGARAAPIAVPEISRPRETAAPRASVFADLVHRLYDERILSDALRHRRQLARLDQRGQLRRLLELLGKLRGVGDDLRTLQLSDQGALGGDLFYGDPAAN